MIAAIYARKSTDQNIADDEKSVTRQVERARAYAVRKGWTVADEYVYVDDGVSGADFVRRPGYLRLMNALKPRAPFQALVMMEQSRLGRSLDEVPYALRKITEAGVRIHFYLTDREVKRETAVDRFNGTVMAFVDEMHREQSRQRTRDAMRRKAERGHVAGGCVYGYRNVRRDDHVEREIVADQAATIRRIFSWVAEGWGYSRIAKALNAEGVPSPTGRGWAVSGVREITGRELYRGWLLYGCTRWEDRGGRKVKIPTPSSEWIRREAPALRIVEEPLWLAAQARLTRTRQHYARLTDGRLLGRPAGTAEPRFLLSGLLVCAHCGHSVVGATQQTNKYGRHRVYQYYVCAGHRERGPSVCAVKLRAVMPDLETAIVAELEDKVLRPDVLEAVEARVRELAAAARRERPDERAHLERQLRVVRGEIDRYVAAIGAGVDLAEVKAALAERKARAERLEATLAGLQAHLPLLDGAALRRRVEDWRACRHRGPVIAQQILRKLFPSRLRLALTPEGLLLTGRVMIAQLLPGAECVVSVVPPGGSAGADTIALDEVIAA